METNSWRHDEVPTITNISDQYNGYPLEESLEDAITPGEDCAEYSDIDENQALREQVHPAWVATQERLARPSTDFERVIAEAHSPLQETGRPLPSGKFRLENPESPEFAQYGKRWPERSRPDQAENDFAWLLSCCRTAFSENRPENDSPPTDEEAEWILKVSEGYRQVGEELGINLAERLPELRYFHFFDTPEDYKRAVTLTGAPPISDRSRGLCSYSSGLLIQRQDPLIDRIVIAHETGHDVVAHRLLVQGNPETGMPGMYLWPAYSIVTQKFDAFRPDALAEWTTDMLTDRVLHKINSPLPCKTSPHINLLGDRIIRHTADLHGLSPNEVEAALHKGSLGGDMSGLSLISSTIGEGLTIRFMHLLGKGMHWREIESFGAEIGLPNIRELVARRIAGDPTVRLFDWR